MKTLFFSNTSEYPSGEIIYATYKLIQNMLRKWTSTKKNTCITSNEKIYDKSSPRNIIKHKTLLIINEKWIAYHPCTRRCCSPKIAYFPLPTLWCAWLFRNRYGSECGMVTRWTFARMSQSSGSRGRPYQGKFSASSWTIMAPKCFLLRNRHIFRDFLHIICILYHNSWDMKLLQR